MVVGDLANQVSPFPTGSLVCTNMAYWIALTIICWGSYMVKLGRLIFATSNLTELILEAEIWLRTTNL